MLLSIDTAWPGFAAQDIRVDFILNTFGAYGNSFLENRYYIGLKRSGV
jgi:hypothetical protein